jgi:hypothetical protein
MKPLVAFFVAFVSFTAPAYADFGDLALGGNLGVGYSEIHSDADADRHGEPWVFASPQFALRVGLLDWLHLDMALGTLLSSTSFNPHISLGFTGAIDVWTVVPELRVGGFVLMGDGGNGFGMGFCTALGLRYHIDPSWSVALGAELNMGFPSWAQGTASFLYVLN